jgi:hypothetical protein
MEDLKESVLRVEKKVDKCLLYIVGDVDVTGLHTRVKVQEEALKGQRTGIKRIWGVVVTIILALVGSALVIIRKGI